MPEEFREIKEAVKRIEDRISRAPFSDDAVNNLKADEIPTFLDDLTAMLDQVSRDAEKIRAAVNTLEGE